MDGEQRHALRILPKATQDLANKATQGSTADLRALYEGITDTEPNTPQLAALLPVFFLHLDPALIPHRDKAKYTSDELGAIHHSRWALKAVGKILDRIPPEDGDSAGWERMFPWMTFLLSKFLLLNPERDEQLGISFPAGDIAQTVVQVFSVVCHSGERNLAMIRSTPCALHYVAILWIFVAYQYIDYAHLHGAHAQKAALLLQDAITRITLSTICPETIAGISVLICTAGNTNRVLGTAVRFVRLIADTVRGIKDPTPDNMAVVDVAANALANCVSFIERFGPCDPAHSHTLVGLGSVRVVTTATRHIARILLASAGRELGPEPTTSRHNGHIRTQRLENLAKAYQYLHFALFHLGSGVTPTCQALDAGVLEAIFRTWLYTSSSCAGHPRPKFAENEATIVLWHVIPCYFVYPRVLCAFARALGHLAFREVEQLARLDVDLWGLWKTLRATAREYIECMEEVEAGGSGLYARRCAANNCLNRDHHDRQSGTESESDSEAGAGVYQRCAGCLARSYCSKACQRADWKAGHRTGCRVLRDSLGTLTSPNLRRSLPLIGAIEKIEYMQNRLRIQHMFAEVFHANREFTGHLAVEIDLTKYPRTIRVVSLNVERYLHAAVSSGWSLQRAREKWEEALKEIRACQLGGMDLLTMVKIWDGWGHNFRTILSPAATLDAFCGGWRRSMSDE
ncbi:hypothetical protein BJ138DRAFT_358851 [Hygrophoropsis aurantiaca]|uniref:Uncharacterized protein n=1 Tax=Hygrophoropsis aurantiaca TaxID=72124 RepID=A0ACB8A5L7_9AGAM|nr:hypothetical protein BJ138DRAFT_358851 [Hygrophoropsis aurantiaca]